jgi:hypothetical protein
VAGYAHDELLKEIYEKAIKNYIRIQNGGA